jgi:hypothetical protein
VTVCYLVECDACRSAYIKASEVDIGGALAYIGSRGWSVVIGNSGTARTICPSCTRRRKDTHGATAKA